MTPLFIAALAALLAGLALGYLAGLLRGARTREELAVLKQGRRAETDKLAWVEQAEQQLRDAFQALAARSLQSNAETFIGQARAQLDATLKQMRGDWSTQREQMAHLVQPVEKGLQALDDQVRRLEQRREGAYRTLEQHLAELKLAHRELRDETGHLRSALTVSAQTRGQWGELQLRRLVEMAGMLSHVDFDEQQTAGGQRPDMIIRMPNEGILPVDAKTSLSDYLKAFETDDPAARKACLRAHAQAMRGHIRSLSGKAYWQQFDRTPEVVVMFVPNETCLSASFEEDPQLIEYGLEQHVLLATPVTLFGLLKAVAYGWQQQAVAENARAIAREAHELCERLGVFLEHLRKAGKGLDGAVHAFNSAVGSAEARLLPSARRLRDLGATSGEPAPVEPVERQVRLPAE
ncbi:MAG: DNA recombination protein RmuC [Lentisphaerae bacterium]|nr:DNA recombination protein RmuC [Lentisphaerota bacterium]